jgi:hypothetical protein
MTRPLLDQEGSVGEREAAASFTDAIMALLGG